MKKALFILLLMAMLFPLLGEDRAGVGRSPASPERWELVTNLYLGIEVRSLTREERAAYGTALAARNGLLVTRVAPGSPAERAGLKDGDLLLYVSGASLASPEDLLICLRNMRPGVPAHFTRLLNGKKASVKIVPEERPEPVVVGYLTPPKLNTEYAAELEACQIRVAQMLAGGTPPRLSAIHSEMESFSKMLCSSYTPGNLRLEFCSGDCSISVTRYWRCLTVTMVEKGAETTSELKKEGDVLPERMRVRLREMAEEMSATKP